MKSVTVGKILIFVAIGIAVIFCLVASYRALSPLENVLLQIMALGAGLVGSYIFGRESAHQAAREMVRPHARSAFRRLTSLYRSLSRLAAAIQGAQERNPNDARLQVLDKLEAIVIEQIATANDALEDWSDILPEDIAELRSQLEQKRKKDTEQS